MAKKTEEQTTEVEKTEEVLVLRARKRLSGSQFNLLSDLVKKEQEKTGLKIVLIPNSVDLVREEK